MGIPHQQSSNSGSSEQPSGPEQAPASAQPAVCNPYLAEFDRRREASQKVLLDALPDAIAACASAKVKALGESTLGKLVHEAFSALDQPRASLEECVLLRFAGLSAAEIGIDQTARRAEIWRHRENAVATFEMPISPLLDKDSFREFVALLDIEVSDVCMFTADVISRIAAQQIEVAREREKQESRNAADKTIQTTTLRLSEMYEAAADRFSESALRHLEIPRWWNSESAVAELKELIRVQFDAANLRDSPVQIQRIGAQALVGVSVLADTLQSLELSDLDGKLRRQAIAQAEGICQVFIISVSESLTWENTSGPSPSEPTSAMHRTREPAAIAWKVLRSLLGELPRK